ncbi:MAG: type I-E CRISPR-associated protein Cas5/CasD [Nitrosomonas sp.]|nr:type I-E CRISPR-associated protein Cas5/CasD [Nitrosomonas sp.]
MSNEAAYLALRLEGPLQSWGFESQYNRRNTGLLPTKSAILGMCCAALGIPRGSEEEKTLLEQFIGLRLLTVAIPRHDPKYRDESKELQVRRITDYHTVQNTKTASGSTKDTHLTYRQYLCDASFACVLSGNAQLINQLVKDEKGYGLENPVWGIWLGRKACIPTAPVFAGIFPTEVEALCELLGDRPLDMFTYQREVERFEDGSDSLPDQPLCFAAPDGIRKFAPRRVKLEEGKR